MCPDEVSQDEYDKDRIHGRQRRHRESDKLRQAHIGDQHGERREEPGISAIADAGHGTEPGGAGAGQTNDVRDNFPD